MKKNILISILSVVVLIVTALILDNAKIFQRDKHRFLEDKLQSTNGLSGINDGILNLPSTVKKQSLQDLIDILNYPLKEGAGVPRIEMSHLPEVYKDIGDTKHRKAMFLRILLPLVLLENEELEEVRNRINTLLENIEQGKELSFDQLADLKSIARKYNIKGNPVTNPEARKMLRTRVDVVPPSLALAQAANESGWGNSRFAMEASNLFGIWTFNKNKGVVPDKRDNGEKHLVRKFDSLRDSVRVYMHTLNTHQAYTELREIRSYIKESGMNLNGLVVAEGLKKYSGLGEEYVRLIQEIIAINDLESLNSIRLQTV
jgi:Bax protein